MSSTVGRMNIAAMFAAFGLSQMPQMPRHAKVTHGRTVHSGRTTFNAGRNAEKRAACNDPAKRMHMLANRRLRQRGVAA